MHTTNEVARAVARVEYLVKQGRGLPFAVMEAAAVFEKKSAWQTVSRAFIRKHPEFRRKLKPRPRDRRQPCFSELPLSSE